MFILSDKDKKLFIDALVKRKDSPYCWPVKENNYSGKDLPGALYPGTYDCSGLITSCLYEATGGALDRRATWNAQSLLNNSSIVLEPKPGDLCFYGFGRKAITHVMAWIGREPLGVDYRCYGSSGGTSKTVTPDIARKTGARVTGYKTHLYRFDFICFGRLLTNNA